MASEIKEHGDNPRLRKHSNIYNPRLLKQSAGAEACCIFRFPHSLPQKDNNAYKPKIVSIGPYHHKEKQVQMIQEHKHRFMTLFLAEENLSQNCLVDAVRQLEYEIRRSYSEELHLTSEKLVEMMILDGCFILMLFLVTSGKIKANPEDPIFSTRWILPFLRHDLLLLENQVPFFLLEKLYSGYPSSKEIDLNKMARNFFQYSLGHIIDLTSPHKDNTDPNHLLDLIRKRFIPQLSSHKTPSNSSNTPNHPKFILSAKTLNLQGINFQSKSNAETLLDIKLENNKLQIPRIVLDGSISSLFVNCVAFEQYKQCSNDVTSYIVFMGLLMKDKDDATFLCNQQIVENCLGTDDELSQFFKNTREGVTFDLAASYLATVYEGINKYTSKCYTGYWADFRHTHFNSPWTIISLCAAITVIGLTVAQLCYAILSYKNDRMEKND